MRYDDELKYLTLASWCAREQDRNHLAQIIDNQKKHAGADVLIVAKRRFFGPLKLRKSKAAISQLLEFTIQVSQVCAELGLATRLVFWDRFPADVSGKIILSHHSTRDMFTPAQLEKNDIHHFKSGDLPNVLTIDRDGFSGWSSLAPKAVSELNLQDIELAKAQGYFDESKQELRAKNISKYAQPKSEDSAPGRDGPSVFVALQTVNDMVQKKAYMSVFDMLDTVVDAYRGTDVEVRIKRHPKCRSYKMKKALERVSQESHVRIVTGSIHSCLEAADAVITVNSGVGSEAMIYALPTYCFGASDYGPIAHQVRSAQEAKDVLIRLEPRVTQEDLLRFYYYYRNIYQLNSAQRIAARIAEIVSTSKFRDS